MKCSAGRKLKGKALEPGAVRDLRIELNAQTGEGDSLTPVGDLLKRNPVDLAGWVASQLNEIGKTDIQVETLPIFHASRAMSSATPEQRAKITAKFFTGFVELPPASLADIIR